MLALIKLQNGAEMVGDVKEEQTAAIVVEDPLLINYKMVASQPMPSVSISRYMPFANQCVFTFNKTDLLHVVEPSLAMVRYYNNALMHYKEEIDDNIERELIEAVEEDEEDLPRKPMSEMDQEELDDAYKTLLERINLKGPMN